MSIAEIAIYLFLVYLAIGLIFSLLFIWKGAESIDNDVVQSPKYFRLLLIPGAIILWPLLAIKWIKK